MLSAAEATERGAATRQSWADGVWSPSDGIADPASATPLIARGVMQLSDVVVQGCAARGIETEVGAVFAVVTERGVIRTPQVVMAGGAWAGSFLHQSGVLFPQASVRSSTLSLAPGALGLPPALHTASVSVTRRADGGHTLAISGKGSVDLTPRMIRGAKHSLPMFAKRWRSLVPGGLQAWQAGFENTAIWDLDRETPMERLRILDPRPTAATVNQTLTRARALLPVFEVVPVQASWAGYIDSTADGVPVIDNEIGIPGLTLAAGLTGHGFGIGPGGGGIWWPIWCLPAQLSPRLRKTVWPGLTIPSGAAFRSSDCADPALSVPNRLRQGVGRADLTVLG